MSVFFFQNIRYNVKITFWNVPPEGGICLVRRKKKKECFLCIGVNIAFTKDE